MQTRLKGRLSLLFLALAVMLAFPAVALADTLSDANDDLKTNAASLNLGDIKAGDTKTGSVNLIVDCAGQNHAAPGALAFDPVGMSLNTGSKGSIAEASVTPSVTIPEDWPADKTACPSTTLRAVGAAQVSVTAGTELGSRSIKITLTTPSTTDVSGTSNFDVTYNVVAADPAPAQNNAPVVVNDAGNVNGSEGATLQNSGSFSDADGDPLTITKASGAGTVTQGANGSWSWSLPTNDDASGSVTVTADDGKGGTVSDSFNYSASNVAPSVQLSGPGTVNENKNGSETYGFSISDPGTADTHQVNASCGANGSKVSQSNSGFVCSFPDGPATSNVSVSATDDDGASGSDSKSVTINNVAPSVQLSGPGTVNEDKNGSEIYNFATTDPGDDAFTVDTASCGANGTKLSDTSSTIVCSFPDGPATSNVSVSATDDDGAPGSDSKSVTINNVAPVLGNLQVTGANQTACLTGGNSVSISYNVSDPGDDTFTPSVNWGDNTPADAESSHTYTAAGTYTIKVNGTDGDDPANELVGNDAVSLLYNMSTKLLSPVNADGMSVFKYGSTIPMKIKITDCQGTSVSGLSPAIKFQKVSADAVTAINETTSTSAADTNNVMRYDSTNGQYIYNLASKSLVDPSATYRAVISEGNSTPNPMTSQNFGLKK